MLRECRSGSPPGVELLVVTAHPDDETLYAGLLLTRLVRLGRAAAVLSLTSGGAGRTLGLCSPTELRAERRREFKVAMAALGVAYSRILDLPDGEVSECSVAATAFVCDAITLFRPRVLCTYPTDGVNGHLDHVAAHRVVKRARSKVSSDCELIYFHPHGSEVTHCAGLVVREESQRKVTALAAYRTQALSVVDFMGRSPMSLHSECFLSEACHTAEAVASVKRDGSVECS